VTAAFDKTFEVVIGSEGGLSLNPQDPGNWTGGAVGRGELRGTNWGISAASYPTKDIASLTLDQAKAIYWTDFWLPIAGDKLPPALALLVFDTAVMSGVGRAVRLLQAALGVAEDGVIGPQTLSAINAIAGHGAALEAEFMARRLVFMAGLAVWPTFSLGWSRRLCALPYEAVSMGQA
jgi:lysozyme family protein